MGNSPQSTVHNASDGGVTATHADTAPFQILAAPTTADQTNTVHLRLIPIACWRVDDIRFAFDSSFVTPDIAADIQALSGLRDLHKSPNPTIGEMQFPPLSVFGHADPVGPAVAPDEYNKALSGRRATAIYALLLVNTDPDTAVGLWQQISRTENWGTGQTQTMQASVPAGTAAGDLMKTYMQTLCPAGLALTPKDFLGQGADPKGKGDYQGCSSFNPMLLFSQQTEDGFQQAAQNQDQAGLAARNQDNAPNRRVMVLLFRVGSQIDPAKWPCPRATEATTGCILRFWSDGQSRRTTLLPDQDRKFEVTHDTFACRFYQRISDGSPCEQSVFVLWITQLPEVPQGQKVTLTFKEPDGTVVRQMTSADGTPGPGDYTTFDITSLDRGQQLHVEIQAGDQISVLPIQVGIGAVLGGLSAGNSSATGSDFFRSGPSADPPATPDPPSVDTSGADYSEFLLLPPGQGS